MSLFFFIAREKPREKLCLAGPGLYLLQTGHPERGVTQHTAHPAISLISKLQDSHNE